MRLEEIGQLIRGVRVEDDKVIIAVRGGNDAARWLCDVLVAAIPRNMKKKINAYDCPSCGYRISDDQWLSARYDYSCPKCACSKLSQFKRKTI